MKKIQAMGNRMYKRNEIHRKEALTKINYQNAVAYFTSKGLTSPETDPESFDDYLEKIENYRKYLQEKMPLLS